MAHLIADNVLALLGARDVTLFALEPQTGRLVSVAFAGEGGAGFSQPTVLAPGVGASGLAVATRREVFTPDILNAPGVTHTPELRAGIERAGYRAVVAVPVAGQRRADRRAGGGGGPRAWRGRRGAAPARRVRPDRGPSR